jgi:hypothetical protein
MFDPPRRKVTLHSEHLETFVPWTTLPTPMEACQPPSFPLLCMVFNSRASSVQWKWSEECFAERSSTDTWYQGRKVGSQSVRDLSRYVLVVRSRAATDIATRTRARTRARTMYYKCIHIKLAPHCHYSCYLLTRLFFLAGFSILFAAFFDQRQELSHQRLFLQTHIPPGVTI